MQAGDHRLIIGGFKGQVVAASDGRGRPCLLEARMAAEGRTLRGFPDMLAASISPTQQRGVPLQTMPRRSDSRPPARRPPMDVIRPLDGNYPV